MTLYKINYEKLRNKIFLVLENSDITHRETREIKDILEEYIEDATIEDIIEGFEMLTVNDEVYYFNQLIKKYPNLHFFEPTNILDISKVKILKELYKKSLYELEKLI